MTRNIFIERERGTGGYNGEVLTIYPTSSKRPTSTKRPIEIIISAPLLTQLGNFNSLDNYYK